MASLLEDYLERVYAGVLGKLIGVYLGRPFEGWTHQRIMEVLGPIRYYVHDHPNMPASPWDPDPAPNKEEIPLVVTDDDVSGTFTFVRALEEHGFSPEIMSEQIGKTWLNQIIEGQTILWWGGRGVSTEHTAYLNLKHGIPAPDSGSIKTNGKTVAEQIGAQIFIDGWAMVAPGNPQLAARLAQQAGSVSHDGESVYAAMLWAAMEAEAFLAKDVDHLLDTGLSVIPHNSAIAGLIADVRQWHASDGDWLTTRQRIEDKYGYDKYCGVCHVMPNHAVMVMALLYGGHDFTEAMHIINTCGWDTDCNSGNVGCLVALMHGMAAFQGDTDWRGPLADRALISSADGGFSITNAASIALEVANIGRRIAGLSPLESPKGGAQFHFTLPGSIQGFTVRSATLAHEYDELERPTLAIKCTDLKPTDHTIEAMTPVFMGKDVLKMHSYPLMASPLLYPGQTVEAKVRSPGTNMAEVQVALRLKVYGLRNNLTAKDSEPVGLEPGKEAVIRWTIPDDHDSQPIQSVGLALSAVESDFTGKVILDSLGWTGAPSMTLKRPSDRSIQFWKRAWVHGVDAFHPWMKPSFCIVKNRGEGILIHGTREWTDYRVTVTDFIVQLGQPAGVAIRVRGLNRYYAIMFCDRGKTVALVKALDEKRIVMASADCSWELDQTYEVSIQAKGSQIIGRVGSMGVELMAEDDQYVGGGVGLVVTDGTMSAGHIDIAPVS
ncbi:hypothetical protein VM1G_03600 [Cytospora mali]|uniref:ADP-ribosylglycohydrolase n=1 Tax=Cytospora mali TaxID=578113 RepID=A0A194VVZ0_CYTMA|nr:hypothetical protein VM1G_03600 [Valsa mali]